MLTPHLLAYAASVPAEPGRRRRLAWWLVAAIAAALGVAWLAANAVAPLRDVMPEVPTDVSAPPTPSPRSVP